MAIIAINGDIASGKTTLAKRLAKDLGYEVVYAGGIFRKIAEKWNLTLSELHQIASTDDSIDAEVDEAVMQALKRDNIIIDSRLVQSFAALREIQTVNMYLACDLRTATNRRYYELKQPDRQSDWDAMKSSIAHRKELEKLRYAIKYGIEIENKPINCLLIDTTYQTPNSVYEKAKNYIENQLSKLG